MFSLVQSQSFVWNKKVYYEHIESVCSTLSEYMGNTYQIIKLPSGYWQVPRLVPFKKGRHSRIYHTLHDAIKQFIRKEPLPEFN